MLGGVARRSAENVVKGQWKQFSTTSVNSKDVLVLSAVRTPVGSFRSSLSQLSATQLGAVAIKVMM